MREIRGIHVLIGFVMAFSVIITVNVILAVNAVRTFPGLEVKNSYIASQSFEGNRVAQEALDWTVSAHLSGEDLILVMLEEGAPVSLLLKKRSLAARLRWRRTNGRNFRLSTVNSLPKSSQKKAIGTSASRPAPPMARCFPNASLLRADP